MHPVSLSCSFDPRSDPIFSNARVFRKQMLWYRCLKIHQGYTTFKLPSDWSTQHALQLLSSLYRVLFLRLIPMGVCLEVFQGILFSVYVCA